MKFKKSNEDIISFPDALDIQICIDFIEISIEDSLFPNSLKSISTDIKKSLKNRVFIDSVELAEIVWSKVIKFSPKTHLNYFVRGVNPRFRMYKYLTGQEFTRHQDAPFEKSESIKSFYSLLIYLNDDFIGGETTFDGVQYKPKAGSGLIFPHNLFHSGNILLEGVKYVLRTDIMFEKMD